MIHHIDTRQQYAAHLTHVDSETFDVETFDRWVPDAGAAVLISQCVEEPLLAEHL